MAKRSPKVKRTILGNLGGSKLQNLRNASGLTLLSLAAKLESELGRSLDAAHINKIETGSIKKPLIGTLEVILTGLHASYRDRRTVLEAFGYKTPMTLPSDQDIEDAIHLFAYELYDTTYPLCLIDHGQRYWAWNRYIPRLFGLHPDDPAIQHLVGATIFDCCLNPRFEIRLLIANLKEFLLALLQSMKVEMYSYSEQSWHQDLISNVSTFPGAKELWDRTTVDTLRSVIPLNVSMPNGTILQFRMSSIDLLLDPRFQILHFIPFGAYTLRTCAAWAEEEGTI